MNSKDITKKASKHKCLFCNKKAAILIDCSKCDNKFCMKHRCPEDHECCDVGSSAFSLPDKVVPDKIEMI